jgi:hypothetical protein
MDLRIRMASFASLFIPHRSFVNQVGQDAPDRPSLQNRKRDQVPQAQ